MVLTHVAEPVAQRLGDKTMVAFQLPLGLPYLNMCGSETHCNITEVLGRGETQGIQLIRSDRYLQ